MAKREFIEVREIVYVNAPISPILQGDRVHYEDIAFKAQIGRIRTFSEQEIVKPYLNKIKEEIMKLDDINPDYPMDRTIHISRNEVLQIINKCKAESEGSNGTDSN